MNVDIEPSWKQVLQGEFEKPYFKDLAAFVRAEYQSKTVFPPPKLIFNAFNLTPFDNVRVVILGQDPYHQPDQAMGLSFSVQDGVRIPPSLNNMYKEIQSDIGGDIPQSGDLTRWATQGVFLLNAILSVVHSTPTSHQKKGWEEFTDAVIKTISDKRENVVFLLWGAYAKQKSALIDESKHLVLTAPHPSPFSADKGFFGCKHFSQTNDYLLSNLTPAIEWVA